MAFFRAVEFLALSIWLGSDVFLSFVVAPGAFSVLAGRDQAGAIVGYSLTRMHWMGVICGVLLLLVRVARTRTVASLAAPAALCVLLMPLKNCRKSSARRCSCTSIRNWTTLR